MHDEIGGKLSRISFLSDMALRSVTQDSAAGRQLDEVSQAAREIIQAVDEIVWAVNPRNDTLESLVHYICRHAEEYFELTAVELELHLPNQFPERQLSAEARHSLFCAVKEVLNNALKHSAATKVQISFALSGSDLSITIVDNGRGFNPQDGPPKAAGQKPSANGNGLLNLRERMESVQGAVAIESSPSSGSSVALRFPLESQP